MSPCIECTARHIGCHGHCGNYKEYREKLDAIKEQVRKEKQEQFQATNKRVLAGMYNKVKYRK